MEGEAGTRLGCSGFSPSSSASQMRHGGQVAVLCSGEWTGLLGGGPSVVLTHGPTVPLTFRFISSCPLFRFLMSLRKAAIGRQASFWLSSRAQSIVAGKHGGGRVRHLVISCPQSRGMWGGDRQRPRQRERKRRQRGRERDRDTENETERD